MNIKLSEVKKSEFVFAFFDLIFLASSCVGVIFFYGRDIFLSLDWSKLILLSIGFAAPLIFFNLIMISILENPSSKEKYFLFIAFSISAAWTSIVVSVTLLFAYLYSWPLREFVLYVCVVEIILALIVITKAIWRSVKSK